MRRRRQNTPFAHDDLGYKRTRFFLADKWGRPELVHAEWFSDYDVVEWEAYFEYLDFIKENPPAQE